MFTGLCVKVDTRKCAQEEETVIHFLCQCKSLARYRNGLFGSALLVSSMELSSIAIEDKAFLSNSLVGSQRGVIVLLMGRHCANQLRPLPWFW